MQSLDTFYEDQRRRESKELHLGIGWRSRRYELFEFTLFWLADTRELCALRSPIRNVQPDGFFRRFILGLPQHMRKSELRDDEVQIEVLAVLPEAQVHSVLAEWRSHVTDPAGFDWVRDRVAAAGKEEA